MRIAILDLGTNTFHLLIAEILPGGRFRTLFRSRRTVKLGRQGLAGIGAVPFERGVSVLEDYRAILRPYRPRIVRAYATSAIRSAANGPEFVREVKKRTGLRIEVIPGDREADLICKGVRQCVSPGNGYDLIMDIGGGSTEFILSGRKGIAWKRSFNTGAARLQEKFPLSDPARRKEIRDMERALVKTWMPLEAALKKFPAARLVGSSGSFETFAAMLEEQTHHRRPRGITYRFDLRAFASLHRSLLSSTSRQRMNMKGLVRMRVDMIVPAVISTELVLRKFGIREMVLSRYALKEGALKEIINEKS